MIFQPAEKEYWYMLKLFADDWQRLGKDFTKELRQRVPKEHRRFIKSKNMWIIHITSVPAVRGLIHEHIGGQLIFDTIQEDDDFAKVRKNLDILPRKDK